MRSGSHAYSVHAGPDRRCGKVDIRCADRHSDLHVGGVDPAELAEHPHALVEFDQRDDERQRAAGHLRGVVHDEAEHRALARCDDVVGRRFFVLPQRGHRRVLQGAVGPLLDPQFVCVHAVPEELGVARRRGPHHRVGVEVVAAPSWPAPASPSRPA